MCRPAAIPASAKTSDFVIRKAAETRPRDSGHRGGRGGGQFSFSLCIYMHICVYVPTRSNTRKRRNFEFRHSQSRRNPSQGFWAQGREGLGSVLCLSMYIYAYLCVCADPQQYPQAPKLRISSFAERPKPAPASLNTERGWRQNALSLSLYMYICVYVSTRSNTRKRRNFEFRHSRSRRNSSQGF